MSSGEKSLSVESKTRGCLSPKSKLVLEQRNPYNLILNLILEWAIFGDIELKEARGKNAGARADFDLQQYG